MMTSYLKNMLCYSNEKSTFLIVTLYGIYYSFVLICYSMQK